MSLSSDSVTLPAAMTPLFGLARKGVPEVVISGVSYFKLEGKKIQGSDPQTVIIARSLLKPWQFLAADVGGEEPFWAMGLASHSGQPEHLEQLRHLSVVARAGEDELFCPRCYPLDPVISSVMQNAGIEPSRLHHPCAGKHLMAIASCRAHNDPLTRYWNPDHPLQRRLALLIGQQVGERPIWMTDSCGMPTIAVTARAHLTMWERLALSDDPRQQRLKRLLTGHARLIGGTGRLDSDLMEEARGRLMAKEGADGLFMLASLPAPAQPVATCFVKLSSGYNPKYLALALYALLSRTSELPPTFQVVLDYLRARLEKWVPSDQELILPPFAAP